MGIVRVDEGSAHPRRAGAQPSGAPAAPRLRVLLLTNSIAIGGMEKHVELLARDLDRSAAAVFAVCPRWRPITLWVGALMRAADSVARITPDRRYGWRAQTREVVRLWRQMRRWRIEVLHIHLTTFEGGIGALLAARLAGVRVVVCTEHLAPETSVPWPQRQLRNLFTRGLDGLVCVSLKNRRARARHLYTPAGKTVIVNNGIDIERFDPPPAAELARLRAGMGIPDGAPVVGTAIRLMPEKGVDDLLAAMPRVLAAAPDAYLLIVGDGELRADLERQARDAGIAERVIFAGFQSDPRAYVGLMDAFVLPVPFGSASIGLLEAMALRRAAIITCGGEGEAVEEDGVAGLCPPPRDPEALAEAILRVLRDPALKAALGAHARARIETAFSSRRVADDLLALYHEQLGAARHRWPSLIADRSRPISRRRWSARRSG